MSKHKPAGPLTIGQLVIPPGFRQTFEVVEGPDRSGRYTIVRGSVKLRLKESELRPAEAKDRSPDCDASPKPRLPDGPERISVDLHGLTVEQALSKLAQTLDRALLQGTRQVEVVHGIGTGRVKKAVLDYIAEQPFVSSTVANPLNPGSTTVYL